jgi:hypothetical protein
MDFPRHIGDNDSVLADVSRIKESFPTEDFYA